MKRKPDLFRILLILALGSAIILASLALGPSLWWLP